MNDNLKIAIYGDHLDNFKNPLIKKIVEDIIIHTPNIFFGASTSSTGKYHPEATNGIMGLVKHSLAVMLTAIDLLNNNTVVSVFGLNNLNDVDKEIILAACLLHDNAKYGAENDAQYSNEKVYTKKEHPRLVAKIAANAGLCDAIEGDSILYLQRILKLIETHMGQWTDTNNKYATPPIIDSIPLSSPKTAQESFVHMCDYIASRKTLDIVSELSLPKELDKNTLDWFMSQNKLTN